MYQTFDKQLDDLYIMGCENIIDNKYRKLKKYFLYFFIKSIIILYKVNNYII